MFCNDRQYEPLAFINFLAEFTRFPIAVPTHQNQTAAPIPLLPNHFRCRLDARRDEEFGSKACTVCREFLGAVEKQPHMTDINVPPNEHETLTFQPSLLTFDGLSSIVGHAHRIERLDETFPISFAIDRKPKGPRVTVHGDEHNLSTIFCRPIGRSDQKERRGHDPSMTNSSRDFEDRRGRSPTWNYSGSY